MRKCHIYLKEEDKESVTSSVHWSLLKVICNAAAEVHLNVARWRPLVELLKKLLKQRVPTLD